MLMRRYGLSPGTVGHELGGASMAAGILGALLAGFLIDALSRRRLRAGKFVLLTLLPLVALPSAFAAFSQSSGLAVALLQLMTFAYPMVGTCMIASIQEMAPNDMRGVAVSLFGLTNTIIGATLGPLLIALATERLFKDPRLVGGSIALVAAPALAGASVIYYVGWRKLRVALAGDDALAKVIEAEAP